jgi:hypothetical protein
MLGRREAGTAFPKSQRERQCTARLMFSRPRSRRRRALLLRPTRRRSEPMSDAFCGRSQPRRQSARAVPDRAGTEAIGEPVPNGARSPSPAREEGLCAAGETGIAVLPDRGNIVGYGCRLAPSPRGPRAVSDRARAPAALSGSRLSRRLSAADIVRQSSVRTSRRDAVFVRGASDLTRNADANSVRSSAQSSAEPGRSAKGGPALRARHESAPTTARQTSPSAGDAAASWELGRLRQFPIAL